VVIDDQMMEFGTLMEITMIKQVYDDGKMDIITRGVQVFRLLEVVKEIPDKLFSGAIVNYPDNESESVHPGMSAIVQAIRELHQLLHVEKSFPRSDNALRSYDVAHLAGMSLQEEYELLQLFREDQRVEYLKRHLQKVLPVVKEMETLKERVKLNGHFRELRSLGFE
jgi:Lon protease-like protein